MAKITDEMLKEDLTSGMSVSKLAEKYNVSMRQVSRRKASLISHGWSPEHDMTKECPEGFNVKGVSTLYDKQGQVAAQWVKTKQDDNQKYEGIKSTLSVWTEELPSIKEIKLTKTKYQDNLAVYPLGDPHIGMASWDDVSSTNWNIKKAKRHFCKIFDRVVKSSPSCKEALIVNLGDFFHYDNLAGVTSRAGNVLDRDGLYYHMIEAGITIIRCMIETALRHHKKVSVINAIGNHDDVSSMMLALALSQIYDKQPRLNIIKSGKVFEYYKYGEVLLGVHHGHTCKMKDLPSVMAVDKPKDWGNASHRYWLTGHIHHDSMIETGGCKVESFRTVAPADQYAFSHGYRSGRDTKCIVYDKLHGEIERHTINVSQIS